MLGWLAVVAGLATLAAGVREIRTGRPVVRRLGTRPDTVRRHGWVCAVLGGYIALFALSNTVGLPLWFDLVLLSSALALAICSIVAYRPIEPLGRQVDPPEDPDAVWKRRPPGY